MQCNKFLTLLFNIGLTMIAASAVQPHWQQSADYHDYEDYTAADYQLHPASHRTTKSYTRVRYESPLGGGGLGGDAFPTLYHGAVRLPPGYPRSVRQRRQTSEQQTIREGDKPEMLPHNYEASKLETIRKNYRASKPEIIQQNYEDTALDTRQLFERQEKKATLQKTIRLKREAPEHGLIRQINDAPVQNSSEPIIKRFSAKQKPLKPLSTKQEENEDNDSHNQEKIFTKRRNEVRAERRGVNNEHLLARKLQNIAQPNIDVTQTQLQSSGGSNERPERGTNENSQHGDWVGYNDLKHLRNMKYPHVESIADLDIVQNYSVSPKTEDVEDTGSVEEHLAPVYTKEQLEEHNSHDIGNLFSNFGQTEEDTIVDESGPNLKAQPIYESNRHIAIRINEDDNNGAGIKDSTQGADSQNNHKKEITVPDYYDYEYVDDYHYDYEDYRGLRDFDSASNFRENDYDTGAIGQQYDNDYHFGGDNDYHFGGDSDTFPKNVENFQKDIEHNSKIEILGNENLGHTTRNIHFPGDHETRKDELYESQNSEGNFGEDRGDSALETNFDSRERDGLNHEGLFLGHGTQVPEGIHLNNRQEGPFTDTGSDFQTNHNFQIPEGQIDGANSEGSPIRKGDKVLNYLNARFSDSVPHYNPDNREILEDYYGGSILHENIGHAVSTLGAFRNTEPENFVTHDGQGSSVQSSGICEGPHCKEFGDEVPQVDETNNEMPEIYPHENEHGTLRVNGFNNEDINHDFEAVSEFDNGRLYEDTSNSRGNARFPRARPLLNVDHPNTATEHRNNVLLSDFELLEKYAPSSQITRPKETPVHFGTQIDLSTEYPKTPAVLTSYDGVQREQGTDNFHDPYIIDEINLETSATDIKESYVAPPAAKLGGHAASSVGGFDGKNNAVNLKRNIVSGGFRSQSGNAGVGHGKRRGGGGGGGEGGRVYLIMVPEGDYTIHNGQGGGGGGYGGSTQVLGGTVINLGGGGSSGGGHNAGGNGHRSGGGGRFSSGLGNFGGGGNFNKLNIIRQLLGW